MGAALALAGKIRAKEVTRLAGLRDTLIQQLLEGFPDALINGHRDKRLPNNVSVSIPGLEPHALIRSLRRDVAFSASSACSSREVRTSHVLLAMFGEGWRARNAFRLGLGRYTTKQEIDNAGRLIIEAARGLRDVVASTVTTAG
jgi:cysteine desulfurase